jgi:hypothetical protein
METYVHLLYMAELLLESEVFQKNVVEKIKTHILCSIIFFFFRKSCSLRNNVEKRGRDRHATDDNILRPKLSACWIIKGTNIHSQYLMLIALPRQ